MTEDLQQEIGRYWGRPGLAPAIFEALQAAGKDLDTLTIDDLAPFDQFHAGGKAVTVGLARLAQIAPGTRVLDVGGGLGGPARTLAVEFDCDVTVVDLTPEYLATGETITERIGLSDRVRFQFGNALELPFADGSFDLIWTQNSGMQIEDKAALYRGFARVLRQGGRLATQEPAAGPNQSPYFPLMWARDASTNFLATPSDLRQAILAVGFTQIAWQELPPPSPNPPETPSGSTPVTLQQIVMGDALSEIQRANARSWQEGRLAAIQGVFERR